MVGRGRHLDATKIMYESGSSPKGREVVALGLKFGPPFFIANLSKTNAEPKKARWTLCGGKQQICRRSDDVRCPCDGRAGK